MNLDEFMMLDVKNQLSRLVESDELYGALSASGCWRDVLENALVALTDWIDPLSPDGRTLIRDAARYRCLRNEPTRTAEKRFPVVMLCSDNKLRYDIGGKSLDAHADIFLRKAEKAGRVYERG